MRRNTRRGRYWLYATWSGISVIGLGSLIQIWLMVPAAAIHAGYGLAGSIAVLALSMLLVAVATAVIFVRRVPKRARSAVAAMLLVAAGRALSQWE